MANEEHLAILKQGVAVWNAWREAHPRIRPDLSKADLRWLPLEEVNLSHANLIGVNIQEVNLVRANLSFANLFQAALFKARLDEATLRASNLVQANLYDANLTDSDLSEARLKDADLRGAILTRATLKEVDLRDANLSWATLVGANLSHATLMDAQLRGADLSGANLSDADLQGASLIHVHLDRTILTKAKVYGLSVWDVQGTPQDQSGLIITRYDTPTITVDDLEVAQFIYLLLNREKLRNVITTITSKAVLILGRFTPERKAVLDAMAEELRKHNLLPIIFDFEGATTRDITETIKTLAGLSLFVIADITNPKSTPLELQATVPDYHIPFIPIIQEGEDPFSMFRDLSIYPWMLTPVIEYPSVEKLLHGFKQGIIDRAWEKHQELVKQKNQALETQSIEDFVQEDEG